MLRLHTPGREDKVFDPLSLLGSGIAEMASYEPVLPFDVLTRVLGRPADKIIKLDANENPYGALPQVSAALAEQPYLNIYPDPGSQALRDAIAKFYRLPVDNILAGAGVDELIDLLMRLLIDPGDRIINCPPTFGMYSFAADLNRARVLSIPRRVDFSLDIEAIEAVVFEYQPKLIFLATPNNPDGSMPAQGQLERLLDLPLFVVLDEAYIEFAEPGSSKTAEVLKRENLVVLRTFSKWAGLAGLRVGYGVFPSQLVPQLWKIKQPYNVSVAASTAAIVSIAHDADLMAIGKKIIAERERLSNSLAEISWLHPYPSQANFVLCKVTGRDAFSVYQQLAEVGILIRYFSKPGLTDHIRISVGKPDHTDLLIEALCNMERKV